MRPLPGTIPALKQSCKMPAECAIPRCKNPATRDYPGVDGMVAICGFCYHQLLENFRLYAARKPGPPR